jgi:hypothetical protein
MNCVSLQNFPRKSPTATLQELSVTQKNARQFPAVHFSLCMSYLLFNNTLHVAYFPCLIGQAKKINTRFQ